MLELYSGIGGMHYALKGKPDINKYRTRLYKECILSEVKMTTVGLDETRGTIVRFPPCTNCPGQFIDHIAFKTNYTVLVQKPSVFM